MYAEPSDVPVFKPSPEARLERVEEEVLRALLDTRVTCGEAQRVHPHVLYELVEADGTAYCRTQELPPGCHG